MVRLSALFCAESRGELSVNRAMECHLIGKFNFVLKILGSFVLYMRQEKDKSIMYSVMRISLLNPAKECSGRRSKEAFAVRSERGTR